MTVDVTQVPNGQSNGLKNGQTEYGKQVLNGIVEEAKLESKSVSKLTPEQDVVLRTFRLLIADLCQQFKGGHPGGAIGMAAIGVALWKYAMRYAPHSPDWFNRDRFVLSNGHTCLFQYCFLHLAGYRAMTFDQLKSYHSARYDALCPGHPEREHEGIEVTTGPLGQGIANAVGMALAEKHLAAEFNRPGYDIVSNRVWCMIGDACLQEGVALEAISLAGHLKLGNLTVMYDNNQITCDGTVDITNTEDVNAKMRACGWNVVDIHDGCFDIEGIVSALEASKKADQPTFVNVRTVIGLGSAVAGTAVAHGVAFKPDDVANMKKAYDFNPEEHFVIPETVRHFFSELPTRGQRYVEEWTVLLDSYSNEHPELAARFKRRLNGDLEDWESLIPKELPSKPTATRASSGLIFNPIAEKVSSFLVGTADLSPSVNMQWKDMVPFQSPDRPVGNYNGRYIHYGIREHGMCAIANGIAAYHPNMLIPVTSSFFMFYLYAAPAVRMSAVQNLQVIHAATHDSIGMGEDGPTHQPIELAALYRAMPNLLYIRPGDSEETAGAWTVAIKAKDRPTIISTSRQGIPQLAPLTNREKLAKGAYVLKDVEHGEEADLTLIGVGAELSLAVQAADQLSKSPHGVRVRVVSFPCQRLFEAQPLEYKRSVLQPQTRKPRVVIEPYTANGWERYADAAVCMSTQRFGQSLPGPKAYEFFGFTVEKIVKKVGEYLQGTREGRWLEGEFVEICEADGKVEFRC